MKRIISCFFVLKYQQNQSLLQEEIQPAQRAAAKPNERRKSLHRQRTQKRLATATSIVAIMTVSFYISWTPYAINSLLLIFGFEVTMTLSISSLLFAKSGAVINPLIYIFANKEVMTSNYHSKISI